MIDLTERCRLIPHVGQVENGLDESSAAVCLEPGDKLTLGVQVSDNTVVARLIVSRLDVPNYLLRASLTEEQAASTEGPSPRIRLDPWKLEGDEVDFGDGQQAAELLLAPTLSSEALYATKEPFTALGHLFGRVALLPELSCVVVQMPVVAYYGLHAVSCEVQRRRGPSEV